MTRSNSFAANANNAPFFVPFQPCFWTLIHSCPLSPAIAGPHGPWDALVQQALAQKETNSASLTKYPSQWRQSRQRASASACVVAVGFQPAYAKHD